VAVRARRVTLWGTALLLKRDVIDAVGWFNEEYFAYHEDLDYCLRALAVGLGPGWSPPPPCSTRPGEPWAPRTSPSRNTCGTERNWYRFWRSYLRGRRRLSDPARYMGWVLNRALNWKPAGQTTRARLTPSMVRGMPSAGGSGPWRAVAPCLTGSGASCWMALLSWHPYLWIRLLAGEPVLGEAMPRLLGRGGQQRRL
jgi:hypothetical protein